MLKDQKKKKKIYINKLMACKVCIFLKFFFFKARNKMQWNLL